MKKLFLLLALPLSALLFAACDKANEKENNNNENDNARRITRVIWNFEELTNTLDVNYDAEGRAWFSMSNEEVTMSLPIVYGDNKLSFSFEDKYKEEGEEYSYKTECSAALNKDGYATSTNVKSNTYNAAGSVVHSYEKTENFTYDNQGYLTEHKRADYTYKYEWSGGNMTGIKYSGADDEYTEITKAIYSDAYENTYNLDINYFIHREWNFIEIDALRLGDNFSIFASTDIYGKRSANLITKTWSYVAKNSAIEDNGEAGVEGDVCIYTYEFDKDGYVTKVNVNAPDFDDMGGLNSIEFFYENKK